MLTVRDRAEATGTFRFIEIHLMETLARWVPATPEMEVKVLFGRHIWECAQNADALGKRTYELRAAMHLTLKPHDEYAGFLSRLADAGTTQAKLAGFYEVALPGIAARYQHYLDATDKLLDAPSVKVIETILFRNRRMREEAAELCEEFPALRTIDDEWRNRMAADESRRTEIVVSRFKAAPA